MKTVEIFDPAMCCSSGVCGTEVDPRLVQFASDLSWLKAQGIQVQRHNLAQSPAAFVANPKVATALREQGDGCLPLVLVDGEVATRSIYPTREQLTVLAGLPTGCCGESTVAESSSEGCCGSGSGSNSCCC